MLGTLTTRSGGMRIFRENWPLRPALFKLAHYPPSDLIDSFAIYAYGAASLLTYVLKQCGDDFSRENVMRQATNIKDYEGPMGLPGAKINTSPEDYRVNRRLQLAKFDGVSWERFGDMLSD